MVFPFSFNDIFGNNNQDNRNTQGNSQDTINVNDKKTHEGLDELNETQQKHLNNFTEFNQRDKKSDKIRSPKEKIDFKLSKLWDKLKINKFFPAVFGVLGKIASGIWNRMGGWFGDLMELMMFALVDPKGSLLVGFINALIPLFMNLIVLVTNVFLSVIPTILKTFLNALPKIIELLVNAFVAILKAVPEFIKIIIKSMPMIIRAITKAVPIIIKAFIDSFNMIKNELFKRFPQLKEVFKYIEEKAKSIKKFFIDLYEESLQTYKKLKEYLIIAEQKIKNIFGKVFSEENIQKIVKPFEIIKDKIILFYKTSIEPLFKQLEESFKTHFEPMMKSLIRIFNSITELFESDMNSMYMTYSKISQGITSIIEPLFSNLDNVLNNFSVSLESIMPIIKDAFKIINKVMDSILSKIIQVLPGIIDLIGFSINLIIDIFTILFEIVSPIILFVVEILLDLFNVIWTLGEIIWDVMSIFLSPVMYLLEGLWSIVSKILWPVVKFIFKVLFGALKFLYNTIKDIFMGIVNSIRDIIKGIKNLFNDIKIPSIGSLIQKAIDKVLSSSFVIKTIGIFESVFNAIGRFWRNLKEDLNIKSRVMNPREFKIGALFRSLFEESKLAFTADQIQYIQEYVISGETRAREKFGEKEDVVGMTDALNKIGENLIEANGGKAETQKLFATDKIEDLLRIMNDNLKKYLRGKSEKSEKPVKGQQS